jgi:hypothetical protein
LITAVAALPRAQQHVPSPKSARYAAKGTQNGEAWHVWITLEKLTFTLRFKGRGFESRPLRDLTPRS